MSLFPSEQIRREIETPEPDEGAKVSANGSKRERYYTPAAQRDRDVENLDRTLASLPLKPPGRR